MFFSSWYDLLRVLVVGVLAYTGLIMFLRLSGKRTLAKMNAFDLIVTVALGSTLATALLSSDVSLVEGLFAFIVLIGLQFLITFTSTRWQKAIRLIKSEPRLIFYRGGFIKQAMNEERVLESEIRHAVRSSGAISMEHIEAVIMETDGTFSVITGRSEDRSALSDVTLPRQDNDTTA